MSTASRVFLGLGGTVDWELVWDAQRIQERAWELGIDVSDLDPSTEIDDERSLLISLLGHLQQGIGGECFVASPELIRTFGERFDRKVTLGGTNIRAAGVLSLTGISSTVYVVAIDPVMRSLLPADTLELHAYETEVLVPHLIVLFPPRARIDLPSGQVTSTRANRVIFANDPPNREMPLPEKIGDAIALASVSVLSTLNVIQERDVLDDRLAAVRRYCSRRKAGGWIVWEDAAYHNPEFARVVSNALSPMVDVFSLNEDEMQGYLSRSVDMSDPRAVAEAVSDLHALVAGPTLVIHTKGWALASGSRAQEIGHAVRAGVILASARYAFGDELSTSDVREMELRSPDPASARFAEEIRELLPGSACVPGYELEVAKPTTIGLGDVFVGGMVTELVSMASQENAHTRSFGGAS